MPITSSDRAIADALFADLLAQLPGAHIIELPHWQHARVGSKSSGAWRAQISAAGRVVRVSIRGNLWRPEYREHGSRYPSAPWTLDTLIARHKSYMEAKNEPDQPHLSGLG